LNSGSGGGAGARALVPRRHQGVALLVVLLILLAVTTSSASFIWSMNQLQARAGLRYRSAAAMALAEAGVYQALSLLETGQPAGLAARPGRSAEFSETMQVGPLEGRFTVSSSGDPDGAIIMTSVGEVAGVTRRLRARVYLTSPAMLVALYAVSYIRLEEPPASTFVLPYSTGIGDRPWIHLAAGREVWFRTSHVAINDPSGSSSRSIRSRAVSLPSSRWRRSARSPPPVRVTSSLARSSATRAS